MSSEEVWNQAVADGSVHSAIDSTAKGEIVARRRFQRGSVFKNRAKTMWIGNVTEYVLNSNGAEKRRRKRIVLGPVRKPDGSDMTRREAQRTLQPYVDRVNAAIASPTRERKNATFEAFSKIWERDYLCMSKPSTQCTMRGHVKRLKNALGSKDMRQIEAGDLQRIIAGMEREGLSPKTIRNLWATIHLVWEAALAQKFVDSVLPKPKLPRAFRKRPKYFRLDGVAKIIAHAEGELRTLYWLAAESGLRAGELFGLRLTDVEPDRITVNQAVWHGRVQEFPKTKNAIRTVALSAELAAILWEQTERQKAKGHDLVFSTSTGKPVDAGLFLKRKLHPFLESLEIFQAGFHAFRHFNASLLCSLRVPLKAIQERLGHAAAGSLTLDVYMHAEWEQNVEAAQQAGEAITKEVNSVRLTAHQQKGPADENRQVLEAA